MNMTCLFFFRWYGLYKSSGWQLNNIQTGLTIIFCHIDGLHSFFQITIIYMYDYVHFICKISRCEKIKQCLWDFSFFELNVTMNNHVDFSKWYYTWYRSRIMILVYFQFIYVQFIIWHVISKYKIAPAIWNF